MNVSREEFDFAFKGKGGVFDRGINDAFFDDIVKLGQESIYRTRLLNGKLPEVYIDFVNNPTLNAGAIRHNNKYFIGIYASTYFLILDLFLRMLSTPKILQDFGDSKIESGPHKIYNPHITDIQYLLSNIAEISPKDPTRKKLAGFLATITMEFLVLHEYAHIIFGHVDYVNRDIKISEAFNEVRNNKIPDDVSQTLEMDADCFSISRLVMYATNFVARPEFLKEDVREFHKDNDMIIRLILFSVYSFFRLFGEAITKATHPPSGIRQSLIISTVDHLIKISGKSILREPFVHLSMDVANSVEDAFDLISEKKLNREAIRYAYSKEGIEQSCFLINNWKKVRPLLEPFAIGNLAP